MFYFEYVYFLKLVFSKCKLYLHLISLLIFNNFLLPRTGVSQISFQVSKNYQKFPVKCAFTLAENV